MRQPNVDPIIHEIMASIGPGVDISIKNDLERRAAAEYGITAKTTINDRVSILLGHRPDYAHLAVPWIAKTAADTVRFVSHHYPMFDGVAFAEKPYAPKPHGPRRKLGFDRRTSQIPLPIRQRIYNAQAYRCAGCGGYWHSAEGFAVDHVVAVAANGQDEPANWQLLCHRDNLVKGARLTTEQLWEQNVYSGYMDNEQHARRARDGARALGKLWQAD